MVFSKIDMKKWKRAECFHHFTVNNPCTYSMTVKLDITRIRQTNTKVYPAMLYAITKVVNRHEEFRMALDQSGAPGFYNQMLPVYTVFHKDTELFSNIWTEWHPDYKEFLKAYETDIKAFGSVQAMEAKPNTPENAFPVSMVPWSSFDGFNLNIKNTYTYLSPIFTMGKFYQESDKTLLPFAIQIHHAACDGFHVCRFLGELQDVINKDF